jgi:ABC-type glutathione transport system ATPase component
MFNRNGSQNQANGLQPNGHKPEESPALIRLRGVQKSYFTAAGEFPALKGIDLNIHAGEFVSIVGKSGSGKTTLINMIAGIDRPTAGEVWVGDTPVHKLSEGQMAVWRGRNLGIVFQFFQLLPTLTVLENVLLPMDFCHRYTPRERVERTMHLLELVEIADQAHLRRTATARRHRPRPGERPTRDRRRRAHRQPGLQNRRGSLRAVRAAGGPGQDLRRGHPRCQPGPPRPALGDHHRR